MGLETADTGQILVNNQPVELFRSQIGMVFQSSALFDSLTVGENVAFALRERQVPEEEIEAIVAEKLALVDLKGTQNLMPAELSGGMQKRVSLARAIAHNPQIVLYDEPTTGLDPITSTSIENLINKLARELKVTSIVVTHQLSTIYRTAQSIYMLDKGKLIPAGNPLEAEKHSNPAVSNFINAGKW
jgi:phospholipid/cholesterol/gamma-HCH transport system ATP-binding protein